MAFALHVSLSLVFLVPLVLIQAQALVASGVAVSTPERYAVAQDPSEVCALLAASVCVVQVSRGQVLVPAALEGAMFSAPDWMLPATLQSSTGGHLGSDGRELRHRSRSPVRNAGAAPAVLCNVDVASKYPITGVLIGDQWFDANVTDSKIREDFMELPLWRRKSVVLKCIEKPPQNAAPWILACIRNYRTSELEKRLTGAASVHNSASVSYHAQVPVTSAATGAYSAGTPGGGFGSDALSPRGSGNRGFAEVSGHSGLPVPSWSSDLLASWPAKKSQMLGKFFALLGDDVRERVLRLPPQTQAGLAFCVAVAGTTAATPDVHVLQWLSRLESEGTGHVNQVPAATPGGGGAAPATHLQLILVMHDVHVALVLAKSFLHVIEKMHPEISSHLPLVIVGTTGDQPDIAEEAQRMRLTVNNSVRDFGTLGQHLEANAANFKNGAVKVMIVSMIPATACAQLSPEVMASGDAALHSSGLRFIWTLAKFSEALRNILGNNAVAELLFAPSGLTNGSRRELTKLVGNSASAKHLAQYNTVATVPEIFATPSGFTVIKCCQDQNDAMQPFDGWTMGAEPQIPGAAADAVVSYLNKALEIQVFEERPLQQEEQLVVESFSAIHEQTGEKRMCSRAWWLRWWGFSKTPLQRHLETLHPCSQTIYTVTGMPCPPTSVSAKPCGRNRYCCQCEKALGVLETVYALPTMVDSMVAVMTKALHLWRSASQDVEVWQREDGVNRCHECGPSCPLAKA